MSRPKRGTAFIDKVKGMTLKEQNELLEFYTKIEDLNSSKKLKFGDVGKDGKRFIGYTPKWIKADDWERYLTLTRKASANCQRMLRAHRKGIAQKTALEASEEAREAEEAIATLASLETQSSD